MSDDSGDLLTVPKVQPVVSSPSRTNLAVVELEEEEMVRATKEYSGEEVDDLQLKEGDVVKIQKKDGAGWAEGVTEDGRKGWFPLDRTEPVFSSPVAKIGTDTGVSALDAFIRDAQNSTAVRKPNPALDRVKVPTKRDSLTSLLDTRTMTVQHANEPSADSTEEVQAAQKKLQKQAKSKKKSKHDKVTIAQGIIKGLNMDPPPFGLTEQKFDRIILTLLDIPLGKQKSGFSSYEDVFTGNALLNHLKNDAIAAVVGKPLSADDAKTFADYLVQRFVLIDVEGGTKFKPKHLYQVSGVLSEYTVMNIQKISIAAPECPYTASVEVIKDAIETYNRYLPDFEALRHSKEIHNVGLQLSDLQRASTQKLEDKKKECFYYNIYNALVLYLHAKLLSPANALDRKFMYESCLFVCDGQIRTLIELENRILQFANPGYPSPYFCLSDCTKSSPAMFVYEAEDFDMTRLFCARHFLSRTVILDSSNYEITVPKLFQRMMKELKIEKNEDVLAIIQPHLARSNREELDRLRTAGSIDIKFAPPSYETTFSFEVASPLSARGKE